MVSEVIIITPSLSNLKQLLVQYRKGYPMFDTATNGVLLATNVKSFRVVTDEGITEVITEK